MTAPAAVAKPQAPAVVVVPPAAASSADAAQREQIVGSWIVAKESADFGQIAAREIYRPDGTYTLSYFADKTCATLLGQVDATWQIDGNQLFTRATRVSSDRFGSVGDLGIDEVVSLDGDRLKLRPQTRGILGWLGHEQINVRQKSDACYAIP